MLLRTSSAPVLSSLSTPSFSPTEACKDSEPLHHSHGSNFCFHSLAPPSVHPGRTFFDGHAICVGEDSSERECRPHHLSRAQSEGNLLPTSGAVGAVAHEHHGYDLDPPRRVSRVPSHSALSSLDLKESILEEIDEPEQSVHAPHHGSDVNLNQNYAQGIVLDDGELYSSFHRSPSGSLLACNDKGCRPLAHSECKKLGFLDMASGIGVNSDAWNERDDGTASDISKGREAYYQTLLQSDPENPLVLRNYAQFLLKKGDVKKSEECLERAILADPNDGEVLSQYAKLQWDVHRDQDRAEAYYSQAVQAAPTDCYVMASYASFLWDVEDNEEDSPSTPTVPAHGASSLMSSPLLTSV